MIRAPVRAGLTIFSALVLACGSTPNSENASGATTSATAGEGGSTSTPSGITKRVNGAAGESSSSGTGGLLVGSAGNAGTVSDRDSMASQADTGTSDAGTTAGLPSRSSVIDVMRLANDYFAAKWPDPGADIVTDKTRPSHIWTRAVYYEGLMALYAVDVERQAKYASYAVAWGESHSWGLNGGTSTRSADNQCAGQTYLDLYAIQEDAARIRDIKTSIDAVVASPIINDWTWVDAIQMAMPVYARLGVLYRKSTYFDKMYAMYSDTKKVAGGTGLYNPADHL